MRRTIVPLLLMTLVAGACTSTEQTQALSLVKEVEGITIDTNQAVADLFDVLDQPYESRARLYERLTDLRLPNTFAIALDKAQRATPPPGTEAELQRYVGFLGELLLASEELDVAIAGEDPTAIAIAAVVIEVSTGALGAALPSSSCSSLTPEIGRDLCDAGDLEGYEAGLGFELRQFVASFRPVFRIPDTFGDVIKGRVLATLQADAALVLQNAAVRISALDPGTAYGRLHQVLLDYFPAAAEIWAERAANAQGSDPLIYGTIFSTLENVRRTTQDLLEAEHELILSARPKSKIVSITDIWFLSPAGSS